MPAGLSPNLQDELPLQPLNSVSTGQESSQREAILDQVWQESLQGIV